MSNLCQRITASHRMNINQCPSGGTLLHQRPGSAPARLASQNGSLVRSSRILKFQRKSALNSSIAWRRSQNAALPFRNRSQYDRRSKRATGSARQPAGLGSQDEGGAQVVCLQMLGADSTSWPVSSPIGGQNHLNAAHRGIQSIGSIVAWRSPRAAPTAAIRPHDTGADQIPEVRGADGGEPAST